MKVILLQDVAKLGRKQSIVDVPDGYAANKLIPKGMAKPATTENIKAVKAHAAAAAQGVEAAATAFKALALVLKDKPVSLLAEANAEGKLFEALKLEKILAAVSVMTGLPLPPGIKVKLDIPIKQVGTHTATLTLSSHDTPFTIIVSTTN